MEAICRAKLAAKLLVSSKEVALSSAKDISGLRCGSGTVGVNVWGMILKLLTQGLDCCIHLRPILFDRPAACVSSDATA